MHIESAQSIMFRSLAKIKIASIASARLTVTGVSMSFTLIVLDDVLRPQVYESATYGGAFSTSTVTIRHVGIGPARNWSSLIARLDRRG
jgi:hypothetical protein